MWCCERHVQHGFGRKTRSFACARRSLQVNVHESQVERDGDEVKNHFKFCLKLFNENKINVKNAWNLKIIDYLTTLLPCELGGKDAMIKAAVTLDVCSKVYACRVDDLYCEGLELATNLNRLQSRSHGGDANELATNKRRRKIKRLAANKLHVVGDVNTIGASVVPKLASPFFAGHVNVTSNGTANMFTNKCPVDHFVSKFMLMDKINNGVASYDETDPVAGERNRVPVVTADVPTCVKICAPFAQFNINEWDVEGDEAMIMDCETIGERSPANDEVMYDVQGVPVAELDGSIHDMLAASKEGEMAIGCGDADGSVLNGELNSWMERRWIGPGHWGSKNLRRSPTHSTGRTGTQLRKKTTLHPLTFNDRLSPSHFTKKYKPVKLKSCPRKCTLPPLLLYKHDLKFLIKKWSKYQRNPNDSQSIPQSSFRKDDLNVNEPLDLDETRGIVTNEQNHLDMRKNLVEAPETVTPFYVQYAPRANKTDMKKLKTISWDRLAARKAANYSASKVRIKETTFKKFYKTLPKYLPPFMKKSVSSHLAFVALLHLANENGLKLSGRSDLSDIKIRN